MASSRPDSGKQRLPHLDAIRVSAILLLIPQAAAGLRRWVVPLAMSEAFGAKFRRVHLWVVPGGHGTERIRPWVTRGAMRWLARTAGRVEAAAMPG